MESDSSSVSHIVRFIISFLSFYCIFGTMTIVRAILQFNWLATEGCGFTVSKYLQTSCALQRYRNLNGNRFILEHEVMTDVHDAPSAACNVGVGEKEPQTEDITAFLTIKGPQKVQPHR